MVCTFWAEWGRRTVYQMHFLFQTLDFNANVGSAKAVEILLENGANPNVSKGKSMTALQAAFSHSKVNSKYNYLSTI